MEFRPSHKRGGHVVSLLLWLTVLTLIGSVVGYPEDEEDYCSRRPGQTCCPGRDDYCTMPILDTVCYCDMFCNRTQTDCCPDFMAFCVGVQTIRRTTTPASSAGKDACYHEGRKYSAGQSYPFNCNNCTCQRSNWNNDHSFVCTEKPCVIREQVIDHVNKGSYGWRASNYSSFWGMALDDGVRYRLGTKRPTAPVRQMNPLRVRATDALPDAFDWRTKLPQAVQPIMDQGDCGSSWAFSSASVASDRLAVQSQLHYRAVLSPQQILSCNRDQLQQGCNGGYIDRAWWYMWKVGVVEDKCYPYKSGQTRDAGSCKIARGVLQTASASTTNSVNCPPGGNLLTSRVFQASPLYRIPPNEREIMKEIMDNGPVQAILEVKEDLYMYQSGVYRHSMPASSLPPNHLPTGFHSVKIVGWGEEQIDGHRVKYWICANSWGPNWGENGYFRIVRGTNECEIESFIVGVWARVNGKSVAAIARQLSRKYRAVTHHRSDAKLTSSNKSQSKPRNKTAKQTS